MQPFQYVVKANKLSILFRNLSIVGLLMNAAFAYSYNCPIIKQEQLKDSVRDASYAQIVVGKSYMIHIDDLSYIADLDHVDIKWISSASPLKFKFIGNSDEGCQYQYRSKDPNEDYFYQKITLKLVR